MQGRRQTGSRLLMEADPHVLQELRRAKDISMNCLSKKARTSKFRRFANSEVLDRFLLAVGAYFEALFRSQQEADGRMATESPGQPAGRMGVPSASFLRRTTVDNDHYDVQLRGKEMAMAYATILLKEGSNYNQIHNEEVFFEALYDFTARVTNTKFDRKFWHVVECELGRMFRSPGFNKQYRKKEEPVQYLPARELWRQRERQRQNAHLVSTRPGTSDGTNRSRSNTGRIPLYGLVAATGQSPIIMSAFRRPVPPGQIPPSSPSASRRPRRRPNTQGSSRASTAVPASRSSRASLAVPGSHSARTFGNGQHVNAMGRATNTMESTQAW